MHVESGRTLFPQVQEVKGRLAEALAAAIEEELRSSEYLICDAARIGAMRRRDGDSKDGSRPGEPSARRRQTLTC